MGYKLIKYFLPSNFVSSMLNFVTLKSNFVTLKSNFVTLVVIILHNIRYYVTNYICK